MSTKAFDIINNLRNEIVKYGTLENLKKFNSSQPKEEQRLPMNAFTRNRKMPLSDVVNFIIWPRAESLTIDLLNYSQLIHSENVTKNNFSKRRTFIHYSYIKELDKSLIDTYYTNDAGFDRWNGYVLLAGDGTTYSLPSTDAMKEIFMKGKKSGGKSGQPLARGIVIKDLLNDMIVGANMEGYGRDEIQLLIEELEDLPESLKNERLLIVLDRKFCAYTVMSKLKALGIDFIIRIKGKFNKSVDDFVGSNKTQDCVTLSTGLTTRKKIKRLYGERAQADGFKVNLMRLNSDIVVMTSLKTEVLSGGIESDIYHKRWDDETTIGFVKNNLQVEIFSGISANSIYQDFYSKIISYNILSMTIRQAAQTRHADSHDNDGKEYRINRNVALGIYKLYMPEIMQNEDSLNSLLPQMLKTIGRYVIKVERGRHNPRVFRKIKHSGKYITMTNYARAI